MAELAALAVEMTQAVEWALKIQAAGWVELAPVAQADPSKSTPKAKQFLQLRGCRGWAC